jgi:hypothetical protein
LPPYLDMLAIIEPERWTQLHLLSRTDWSARGDKAAPVRAPSQPCCIPNALTGLGLQCLFNGTAEQLHINMAVRNGYSTRPGPASTGIPVYGFADPGARNVIDLTLRRGWRN